MFSTSTSAFIGTNGYVVRKSSVLSGGPIVVTTFNNLATGSGEGPFTPQGVDNFDTSATEGYFIGVSTLVFGRLDFRRVSDPGGTPTISANILLTVSNTASPRTVPHLGNTGGTNGNLDASDDRLSNAVIRNGHLWTSHTTAVTSSGVASGSDSNRRDASRWYEITNLGTAPTIVQSGTVFDSAVTFASARNYFMPSIMVSGQGHAAMGFSTAGTAFRADAATTGRLATDVLGTMQAPVSYTATTFAYNPPGDPGGGNGRRWGDYSYTSLDPSDDMTMWTIQEFCSATNLWGVQVVKLVAPPPATPSTSSNSVNQGASNVNVVITGTPSSGSGFFDPGPGFTNRISASIGGGGVTVNSVTYTDPTHITLNLSVAGGAATGLRTVTITNPDGQAIASASGILNVVATIGIWDGDAGDGLWNNPINWSSNQLPGVGDDTVIDLAGSFIVTLSGSAASVKSLTLGGTAGTKTLAVNTSLTLATSSVVNATGALQLTSGTLGGAGNLSISGAMTWSGGTIGGAGAMIIINSGGTMSITGAGAASSARGFQITGLATVASGGNKVLKVPSIAVTSPGKLDLNDNDLIVDYPSSTALPAVQALINSARAGGAWTGFGITSTAAKNASPRNTTLGAIEASDYKAIYGPAALFAGQMTDTTAVLVKYTYYGDADFNGVVNFDDYSRIDSGFLNTRTGWLNGDFDGNGSVNFDDYSLIDLAFNTQGAALRPLIALPGSGKRLEPFKRALN